MEREERNQEKREKNGAHIEQVVGEVFSIWTKGSECVAGYKGVELSN